MSPPTDPRSEVFRARQLASQVGQLTLWDDPLQPTRARRSNSTPGNTGGDVETLQGGCVDPEVLAPTVSGVPSSMNIPGALRDGVVHGNALDFLPRMKDESVDLFFMSPPYADQRAYSRIHPDRYVDWFLPFARAMFDATTQSGSMVLNIKNRVAGSGPLKGQRHPYVYELVLALQHMGWRWIETYIWAKPNAIPGKFGPRTKDSFEYVYHFSRGPQPFFNLDSVRVPYKSDAAEIARRARDTSGRKATEAGFGRDRSQTYRHGGADPGNVVAISQTYNQFKGAGSHTAAMPEGLAEFFIRSMSPENGLVVDPFAGSGTTVTVARRLGRRSFGIELHEEYVAEARARIAAGVADDIPGMLVS